MIGGTAGSEANAPKPSASQSKITQTRSSWLGSRKTIAPLDPCSCRFSAPLVEKVSLKRSRSSTVVLTRIIALLLFDPAPSIAAGSGGDYLRRAGGAHRANALCGADEVLFERPDRRSGSATDAGLLVHVLDVVADGLGRDAELVGDRLVRIAAHEHEQDLELAFGEVRRPLPGSLPHAVAACVEYRIDCVRVEPPLLGLAQERRL